MPACSQDLRQRVIDFIDRKEGSLPWIRPAAYVVSLSFVVRLLQLHRRTGSLDPKPSAGGRPAAARGPDDLERLQGVGAPSNPMPLSRSCAQQLGASCSLPAIWRFLEKLRLSRAEEGPCAPASGTARRPREEAAGLLRALAGVDPQRLVFVDASGANTAMTRTYGRTPRGRRRVYAASATGPLGDDRGMTCGLQLSGVTAAMVFGGTTNTGTFESYVEQVLVPELRPGDVVIWDNPKPHLSEEAVEAIEAVGARVVRLPPWSPDLTPIEEMFSKVKDALRSAGKRTKEAVYEAIASALHDVTPEDIAGWFQDRAAYAMQS